MDDDASPFVAVGTAYALTDASNVGGDAPILALAERARKILATATDDLPRGLLTNALGNFQMSIDAKLADELLAEATQLLRKANDPRWTAPVQNRFLTAWVMNSRESEHEILSLAEEHGDLISPVRLRVGQTAFKVLAEEYDDVISSTETLSTVDDWAKIMFLLYRMQAERATGRPEAALETIKRFTAMPSAITDGWKGWNKALAHLQLGDVDAAIATFSAPGAFNQDLPPASDRANVAWFWSMIAERRGEYGSAAVLMGFASALSKKASVSLLAFDQRLVEESRSAIREALGEKVYGETLEHGAKIAWEDLPLVHP
ncbi:MAG TPA: hypothetical protein VM848_06975 [Acidimicrobiia bacterium]|nr:hypothetical protein [Acidimicrobiia bacterium]